MMDRRGFLEAVAAGSVLAAAPFAAQAGSLSPRTNAAAGATKAALAADAAVPVRIVHRGDLLRPAELAEQLASSLRSLGIATTTIAGDAGRLGSFATVDGIVSQAHGARIVGLLDDAGAVVFQQIAAMRGRACVVEARHRFGDGVVRHCVRALDERMARSWSEPLDGWAGRMSRRHAQWLAGASGHPVDTASTETTGRTGAAGIVSFVIAL